MSAGHAAGELKISGQHEHVIVLRRDGAVEMVDTIDLGFPIGLAEDIAAFVGQAVGAEVASDQEPLRQFPLGQVFTLLFLMLGPFKIIGPFLMITQGADDRLARRIALWAATFAALALLVAGFLGETFLSSYGVPLPVLALAGGIILFLVALKNVLEQFEPASRPPQRLRFRRKRP